MARALAWHARGHEFDSRILHYKKERVAHQCNSFFFYRHAPYLHTSLQTPGHQLRSENHPFSLHQALIARTALPHLRDKFNRNSDYYSRIARSQYGAEKAGLQNLPSGVAAELSAFLIIQCIVVSGNADVYVNKYFAT